MNKKQFLYLRAAFMLPFSTVFFALSTAYSNMSMWETYGIFGLLCAFWLFKFYKTLQLYEKTEEYERLWHRHWLTQ